MPSLYLPIILLESKQTSPDLDSNKFSPPKNAELRDLY
jgi:hypothetical protein